MAELTLQQKEQLAITFRRLVYAGRACDSIELARAYYQDTKERLDWHECSIWLEAQLARGALCYDYRDRRIDGQCRYNLALFATD